MVNLQTFAAALELCDLPLLERVLKNLKNPSAQLMDKMKESIFSSNIFGYYFALSEDALQAQRDKYPNANIFIGAVHESMLSEEDYFVLVFDNSAAAKIIFDAGIIMPEPYLQQAILAGDIAFCKQLYDVIPNIETEVIRLQPSERNSDFNVLSWAAACTQPECVRFFAEKMKGKEFTCDYDPYDALPEFETPRYAETIAALIDSGIEIREDTHAKLGKKFMRGQLPLVALAPLVATGLNLDVENSVQRFVFGCASDPLGEVSGRDTELNLALIDLGVHFSYFTTPTQHILDIIKNVPILLDRSRDKTAWELDSIKMAELLQSVAPEKLACRCASFDVLSFEIFKTIAEHNKLTHQELFTKLPPYLQKSDRITHIRQGIAHTAAAGDATLDRLRSEGKKTLELE